MSEDQANEGVIPGQGDPAFDPWNSQERQEFQDKVAEMQGVVEAAGANQANDPVSTTVITGPNDETLQERQAEEAEISQPVTRWHPSDAPRDLYMQASELDAISKGKTDQVDVDLAFGHAVFNAALNSLVKDLDMGDQLVKERVRTPVLRARKIMADALKEAMVANGERKKLG